MRLPLAALLLLAACSGSDTTTTGDRATVPLEPTVRDSAGITILEHPEGALDRAPLLARDSVPLFTISGDDDADLSRVRSAEFTSDGGIVYYDPVAASVVFVNADGTVRRRAGRSGSGPGEFGRFGLSVAVLPGDSVVVTDASNARLTVLHADSGVVRMLRWQPRLGGNGYVVDGALRDGRWLARPSSFVVAGTGAPEPGTSGAAFVGTLRAGNDSVSLDTVATVRVPAFVTMAFWFGGKKQEGVGSPLFQLMPGAVAWHGEVVTWQNDAWELVRRDATTGVADTIHRVVGGAPPPPADTRDSLVAHATRTGNLSDGPSEDPDSVREDSRRTAMEMPIAERISPFAAVRTGTGRLLWVEAQVPSWVDSTWVTAIDAEGRLVGTIRLPAPFRVLAIADDRVALREEDDDGVVTIRVYRLKTTR